MGNEVAHKKSLAHFVHAHKMLAHLRSGELEWDFISTQSVHGGVGRQLN
jgi:hypothetical protein